MNVSRILARHHLAVGLLLLGALTGCQTNIGGQTLPSATYLEDDVQYFPAGPEFLLPNQVRAIQEFKAARATELGEEAPPPANPLP